jgi:hypothetical protein
MALKHLPFVSIVLLLLIILTGITLGAENLSEKLKFLGFWFKENGKC